MHSGKAAIISPFGEPWRVVPMKKIADAGLLVAFLDRRDLHHKWAADIFERESPPFYTADPIMAEVAAVVGTADEVLRMVETATWSWRLIWPRRFRLCGH